MSRLRAAWREGRGCLLLIVMFATWIYMAACTAIVTLGLL